MRAGAVIFGVGTDVVEIDRIRKALERWGERFAERILSRRSSSASASHRQPAAYLAKRFAAKEAFTKALGTGIKAPANWHGVWVVNLPSGKPELQFSDAADRASVEPAASRAPICRWPTSAASPSPP